MTGQWSGTCDGCDYKVEWVDHWHHVEGLYRMADDAPPIPLLASWAWCYQCASIVGVERLLSVDEILVELRASRWNFDDWGKGMWKCTCSIVEREPVSRSFHRGVLKAMLAWRRSRKSSARCLRCGATEFNLVGPKGTVSHPGCGGNVLLEIDAIWTGICLGYRAYDSEGNRDGWYGYDDGRLRYYESDELFERMIKAQGW